MSKWLKPVATVGDCRSLLTAVTDWSRCTLWVLGLISAVILCPGAPAETSEILPLAHRSLLLDVARAGSRLIVVGDRGHILLSDDEGGSWRQVQAPTRAMLTGIAFGDAHRGWAVGHDGTILYTTDGGQSWQKQAADADLESVFLDVHFRDAGNGFAIGAYGKCLRTSDAGKTWTATSPSADEVHYNQIAASPDGTLFLAGEGGTLLVSRDNGAGWRKLEVPYEGSLFGLLPIDARTLLAYGLRGHVFLSDDAGATWTSRATPASVLIMAGVRLKSGPIVLAGLGGNFFISRDRGQTFHLWKPAEFPGGVASLLELQDGGLLAVGESGVVRLRLPEAERP